ncbi:helix-turn-helix domain-containing protein [Streptomyces sp. NPDC058623]|uniref:helix-turn-helix domain-containing protein n=1 Tax=Streptomyces sp. NPDC058623 TaxID=3346563 RepID=UPI003662B81C
MPRPYAVSLFGPASPNPAIFDICRHAPSRKLPTSRAATKFHRKYRQRARSPKRTARLVRFDHAAHRLAAGHGAARVAAGSGYFDQSHLHRDALAFTTMTPATVVGQPWLAVDGIAWAEHGVSETD